MDTFSIRFPQDKQELLRQFVMNDENLEKVETQLTVSREQEGEVEHKKELLTIAEMKRRNFSEWPVSISVSLLPFGESFNLVGNVYLVVI